MQHSALSRLLKQVFIYTAIAMATPALHAQAPTPATADPVAAADPAAAALERVRQAYSQQNYAAARAALDEVRRISPDNPAISLYQSMIERREAQGQTTGGQSPVRPPRAGVTPAPRPEPTATPVPTPLPTPAPTPAPAAETSAASSIKKLTENPMVLYGGGALLALIILGLLFAMLKKRKRADAIEETAPVTAGYGLPGGGLSNMDYSGAGGLGTSPLSTDYTSSSSASGAYGGAPEEMPAAGSPMSGSLSSGLEGYTVPTFGLDDEEESAPPPPRNVRPAAVEQDTGPVNLFADEPTVIESQTTLQPVTTPEVHEPSSTASFESLGINFGNDNAPSPSKDETVMLSNPSPANVTPRSTPSIAPGTVDLEDIFQAPAPAADDTNSQTLPTFVSSPGEDIPVDNRPAPAQNVRPANSDSVSLSFEELFGSGDASTAAPSPITSPAPDAPTHASIEDALGEMAASQPFDEQPTILEPVIEPASTESLDERSERMFMDQMEKARAAFGEQNWRQAVHFLSIASALHPENDEARQMLKEARAEKRKAEESV